MKIYFLSFHVEPSPENEHYEICKAAEANFWVAEKDETKALEKAKAYLATYPWIIKSVVQSPVVTTHDNFADQDIGLTRFHEAQQHGLSLVIAGWSRDGQTSAVCTF